jgi:nucleotide-binding universal stress UspA family protein
MSYATLMVYVEVDGHPKNRVTLATELSDKFKSTLMGLSALAIRPLFLDETFSSDKVTGADIERMKLKVARQEDWFRRSARTEHGKVEWRSVLEFPIDAVSREARCADLIILGRTKTPGDEYSSLDPGAALLRIGRPTLIVPDAVSSLRADHVLIAWKDTREARRAVSDALPFLHSARHVTIVGICETEDGDSVSKQLDDVADYLARHGISGDPRVIPDRGASAADQLTKLAHKEGADLLVAGAYGHSRLGEWFFGGVTRDLLAGSPICCLMSH